MNQSIFPVQKPTLTEEMSHLIATMTIVGVLFQDRDGVAQMRAVDGREDVLGLVGVRTASVPTADQAVQSISGGERCG